MGWAKARPTSNTTHREFWTKQAETLERRKRKEVFTPMFATVENDRLKEILAGSRKRGQYGEKLDEFLAGDEAGVQVDLNEGEFAGKTAATVKVGFANALKKAKITHVRLVIEDGSLFMIDTNRL